MYIKYIAILCLLMVLSPLLVLSLRQLNREKEPFAASQGGVLIQLATSHVASEEEVLANLEYQKRQVTKDIQKMTEPEHSPGPFPAYS